MSALLAVDLGIRTGLACFDRSPELKWYRSRNFGSRTRLREAAYALLESTDDLQFLVIEGGGDLATIWAQQAHRLDVPHRIIDADQWRQDLLHPRERRSTRLAKQAAIAMARRVIDWSGAPAPTSLRHDAAEAILVGLWTSLQAGWIERLPLCVTQR